jgi:hypothetical protein
MKLLYNPLQLIFSIAIKPFIKGIAPWVLPAIFATATVAQIDQSRQASRRQKRANVLNQRIADIKAQRERVRLIGEARRKAALLAQQAELTGVAGSSGAIGGQMGVTAQAASGLSFLDQVSQLGTQANIFTQKAADAQSRGAMFGAVAGLAGQGMAYTGAWEKLFPGQVKKASNPLGMQSVSGFTGANIPSINLFGE